MEKLKTYKKDMEYSYTFGPFPTMELVLSRPELVERVIMSENFTEKEKFEKIFKENNIFFSYEDKTIKRIGKRENIYVLGVFKKFNCKLDKDKNHLVLDNIRDMGNLGTIIRAMTAFDIENLALIGNTCDIFNPKVVRGSMGALFKIKFKFYEDYREYKEEFPKNKGYAFMLDDTAERLHNIEIQKPYSLIFGNEGSGLGEDYEKDGDIQKVIIEQSEKVDSLNLSIASSIGMYEFKMKG